MNLTITNSNQSPSPIVFRNKNLVKANPRIMESMADAPFKSFNIHIENAGKLRDFLLGGYEKFEPKTTIDAGADYVEGINAIKAYFNVSNGCIPVAGARVSAYVDSASVTPEKVVSELFRNLQNLIIGEKETLLPPEVK